MKIKKTSFYLLLIVLMSACFEKENMTPVNYNEIKIKKAQQWFDQAYQTGNKVTLNGRISRGINLPLWTKSNYFERPSSNIVETNLINDETITASFDGNKNKRLNTRLVIFEKGSAYEATKMQLIPTDSFIKKFKGDMEQLFIDDFKTNDYSGLVNFYEFSTSRLIVSYLFKNGKVIAISNHKTDANGRVECSEITYTYWTVACAGSSCHYSYDYSVTETYCTYSPDFDRYSIEPESDKSGSSGSSSASDTVDDSEDSNESIMEGGPNEALKITNKELYLKCFDKNEPAELTLYSDQPKPNSDASYSGANVGHVWISISQTINGINTTRTFGFYPNDIVKPTMPKGPSVLVNDSNHQYDVSVSFSISSQELRQIIDYVTNQTPNQYDLNDMNCTNFVVNSCNAAGINLPRNYGTWPLGGGLNPGRFGQDLRILDLPNKVEIKDLDGGSSLMNNGTCDNG